MPRHLLALVRGQLERNEMLPRKLDRTGTNAHTSIGVHREPDCADQRLANHLPVVAKDVESFDAVDPERGKVDSITGTIKTFPNVLITRELGAARREKNTFSFESKMRQPLKEARFTAALTSASRANRTCIFFHVYARIRVNYRRLRIDLNVTPIR